MALPFLPLLFEMLFSSSNAVSQKSLILFSAMYALSIGLSSNSKLMFGFTIVISIFFSVAFGVVAGGGNSIPNSVTYSYFALFGIFIIHGIERYNRHVIDQTPFWDFSNGGAG